MTKISLVATDQLLSIALQPKLAAGDQNSVELHVDFDSKWDRYGKSAVFFTENNNTVYEVLLTYGNCVIPHEVLAKSGILYIGVRGVNASDNAVKTSSLVKYKIAKGAPIGNGTTVEPTPNVYQQLLSAYEKVAAAVLYAPQTLTDKQKEQARKNIGVDAIPTATKNDAGKFLRVSSDGKWISETVQYAEGVDY